MHMAHEVVEASCPTNSADDEGGCHNLHRTPSLLKPLQDRPEKQCGHMGDNEQEVRFTQMTEWSIPNGEYSAVQSEHQEIGPEEPRSFHLSEGQ